MELVCPICNAISTYLLKCSQCGHQMENMGALQDYFDDYSPYLPLDLTQRVDDAPDNNCVHLFYCENCNNDKRISIHKMLI